MRQFAHVFIVPIVLSAALITAACAPAPPVAGPMPSVPAPLDTPAATAGVVVPTARPTATEAATALPLTPSPSAGRPETVAPFIGPGWGEYAVYEPGLIPSERGVLTDLAGASEYRIAMAIGADYLSVSGRQQVRYTNNEDTALDELYFRLFPNAMGGAMTVSAVSVNGASIPPELAFEDSALRVPLAPVLAPGQQAVVEVGYQVSVPEDPETGYGLLSYSGGVLALDSPYPMIPVYDDEGWNVEAPPPNADTSYNDPSFYLVQIVAPRELVLVTSGVEIDRTQHNGEQVVTFAAAPARDFFVAGSERYEVVAQQAGEVNVRSYALAGRGEEARAALRSAVGALDSYGRRFGPYPYSELDLAATPMLALGIEYPGIMGITTALYEEPTVAGRPARDVLQSTVAHEVAHQWFYNLVGNDQVDEPWLDEAMAQFATGLYFLDVGGEAAEKAYRDTWYGRWDRVDRADKPVGLPADRYEGREYSAVVYGRGPLFVNELRLQMGEEPFARFLRMYSEEYRWGIATTEGFRKTAESVCACDLSQLFEEWVYE